MAAPDHQIEFRHLTLACSNAMGEPRG